MFIRSLSSIAAATIFTSIFATSARAAELPRDEDLVNQTWCYATNGGTDVETWNFDEEGRADVVVLRDSGTEVRRPSKGATWRLRGNRLAIRIPKVERRVFTIESTDGKRLIFKDGTHALVCRPR